MRKTLHNIIKLIFIAGTLISIGVVGYFSFPYITKTIENVGDAMSPSAQYIKKHVSIGQQVLIVDIASTEEKQIKGLSGRSLLGPNEGMLFLFPSEEEHGMWMKDMKFSIDILWVDKNNKIVHIEENVSPDTYPTVFKSPIPVTTVLEVSAQFVAKNKIKIGDIITIY